MNDAEYEAQKERIIALSEKWQPIVGLGDWDITLVFHREGPLWASGEYVDANATAQGYWEYMRGTITWNTSAAAELSDARLEEVVVHELMHLVLLETREDGPGLAHEERVATVLARAFVAACQALE